MPVLTSECVTVFYVTPRAYVAIRLNPDGIKAVDEIAAAEFEGNRSMAIRRLVELGLAAWRTGARASDDIGRTES